MPEDQTVFINPEIQTETGKNAEILAHFIDDKLRYFLSDPGAVKYEGYAGPLAKLFYKLKILPGVKYEDVPGKGDEIAEAIESDNVITFDGQLPSTWHGYMRKRKDYGLGLIADYVAGPALRIANGIYAGFKDNLKDAQSDITAIENRYPIDPNVERNTLAAQILNELGPRQQGQAQTPEEPASTSPSPTSPGSGASTYYRIIREIPVNGAAPELYEETEEGVKIKFQNNNKGG